MKRILVGIDGSRESALAAEKAADLASAVGASLQLLYVVPHHVPPGPGAYVPAIERRDLIERDYVPALLRDSELRCRRPGVAIDTATAIGPVADALAETAARFDLVVVGHRGRGAVAETLLGSVAKRLVQISPRPVLVVR